ncbi:MAG: hypothetical protein C0478_14475 [Planctomyces sp.]|nr:hypothetical protein [Planctomyces sp.]
MSGPTFFDLPHRETSSRLTHSLLRLSRQKFGDTSFSTNEWPEGRPAGLPDETFCPVSAAALDDFMRRNEIAECQSGKLAPPMADAIEQLFEIPPAAPLPNKASNEEDNFADELAPIVDPAERRVDWRMNLSVKVAVIRVSKERLPLPQVIDELITHRGEQGEALDISFSGCAVAIPARWLPGERLIVRLLAAQPTMGFVDAVSTVARVTELGQGMYKLVCRHQVPLSATQLERLTWSAHDPWSPHDARDASWPMSEPQEMQATWSSAFNEMMSHDDMGVTCVI